MPPSVMRTRRSWAYTWQGRPLTCVLSSRTTLTVTRTWFFVAPVIARTVPSMYSLFVSAARSAARYASTVAVVFGKADIDPPV